MPASSWSPLPFYTLTHPRWGVCMRIFAPQEGQPSWIFLMRVKDDENGNSLKRNCWPWWTAGINNCRISLTLGLSHPLILEVNLAPGLLGTSLAERGHAVTLGAWLFKARTALPQPRSPLAYTGSVSSSIRVTEVTSVHTRGELGLHLLCIETLQYCTSSDASAVIISTATREKRQPRF